MDMALFYAARRDGERADRSGVLIPVWADLSSHKAFRLLSRQIRDLSEVASVTIDRLGLVVNHYDARRGTLVRSNLEQWEKSSSPSVLAVFEDLKEARESADGMIPLLEYAPDCHMAQQMRELAKELAA
jgi:chromosome partitioning protein